MKLFISTMVQHHRVYNIPMDGIDGNMLTPPSGMIIEYSIIVQSAVSLPVGVRI